MQDAGASGSSLAISKSDGSIFIAVWNEPAIWDAKSSAALTPQPSKVYDPLLGLGAIASGQGSPLDVHLSGSPILIQVQQDR